MSFCLNIDILCVIYGPRYEQVPGVSQKTWEFKLGKTFLWFKGKR